MVMITEVGFLLSVTFKRYPRFDFNSLDHDR